MKNLPVTVISGFSGAGKSAVVKHLLANRGALKLAVIVNSMEKSDDGIAQTCENVEVGKHRVQLIELTGGCICCSLQKELLRAVADLAKTGKYDAVIIEAAGIAEPMAIADTLAVLEEQHQTVGESASIDTMVTVVDALSFMVNLQSVEELCERGMGLDDEDNRDVARLLIDQIEFSNVILLNKSELVSKEVRESILEILKRLNPSARVVSIERGRIPVEDILNTGLYQQEWAIGADGWQAAFADESSTPANVEGICSFVYRARRPFHPQRFWDFWMTGDHAPWILRSKGYFWLATRHATAGYWSHVGQVLAAEPGGAWWAETPREEWPKDDPELLAELNSVWDEVWGDRRQELLMIGQGLDTVLASAALDECLLTDAEMQSGPKSWMALEDPFGSWEVPHACDGTHDHDHDHDHGQ